MGDDFGKDFQQCLVDNFGKDFGKLFNVLVTILDKFLSEIPKDTNLWYFQVKANAIA